MNSRTITLASLNTARQDEFVDAIGFVFEHSPWIAAAAWHARPFPDRDALYRALSAALDRASEGRKLALIQAHPDLAGKAALANALTTESTREQASVGLDSLTPSEFATFNRLNAAYGQKFGFPFIICARENTKTSILVAFEARLANDRQTEIETALREITKIARLRLYDVLGPDESTVD